MRFQAGDYHISMRRGFRRLSDFIQKHGIEQVISLGPSATPFARALIRAHSNRYGKKLHLENLGEVGELARDIQLSRSADAEKDRRIRELLTKRPGLRLDRKTLLFDEYTGTGLTMGATSIAFGRLGLPHKTAVLTALGHPKSFPYRPDIIGTVRVAVHPARGILRHFTREMWKSLETTARGRKLRKELREIADSVPKK